MITVVGYIDMLKPKSAIHRLGLPQETLKTL